MTAPTTPKAIADEFKARAKQYEDTARTSAHLVSASWVVRSAPGLYLKRSVIDANTFRPTALQNASLLPELTAKRMAADLQDCNYRTPKPARKLVAVSYTQALADEAAALRELADEVLKAA